MTALEQALPAALPFSDVGPTAVTCHPMQCVLRLTWDHVEPFAPGGSHDASNLAVSCGACDSNKGNCTLDELGVTDPRGRFEPSGKWHGLDGGLGSRPLRIEGSQPHPGSDELIAGEPAPGQR